MPSYASAGAGNVEGIRPDNRPLRYPMVPFRILDDQGGVRAGDTVPAPGPFVITGTDRGKQIFYKYGSTDATATGAAASVRTLAAEGR